MKERKYTDPDGRMFKVLLPDDAPDEHTQYGIVVGPPSLESLYLPLEIEVRLNNELYYRGLFTKQDVRRHSTDVQGAVHAALKLDIQGVIACYEGT